MFEYLHTARFYEIDRAGIVFFGRVYEYCHAAFEELLSAMLGHGAAIFDQHKFGMPLVHSEADYKAPIRMGDRLRIEARLERLGARSVTFTYAIIGADDGIPRANVKLVHAFIDMASFTGIAAPEVFRDGLIRMNLLP